MISCRLRRGAHQRRSGDIVEAQLSSPAEPLSLWVDVHPLYHIWTSEEFARAQGGMTADQRSQTAVYKLKEGTATRAAAVPLTVRS
jgi:hypothetical protein